MEAFVLILCLMFQLVFFFLTLVLRDKQFVGVLGIVFGFYVISDLFVNGLTETIAYVGGEEIVHTYSVDAVILIPVFLLLMTAVVLYTRLRA